MKTILPSSLVRFFFSDDGSTAVEAALKMAYQYWYNQGEKQRNLFMSFDGGYHGDTFGCMAVGQKSHFHDPFSSLLFDIISLPFPNTWENDPDCEAKETNALDALEVQLKEHGHKTSAIILEPLVQGAGGMRMCRSKFIKEVVQLVRQFGILVIFDEVMTGFGRTGTYFATEQITDTEPDFMCISKGITGGFLPLALTVTTKRIYDEFLSRDWNKAFAHGHSYTANPIACAAAIASFHILMRQSTKNSIHHIFQSHQKGLKKLSFLHEDKIQHMRIQGTIAAFDVKDTRITNAMLKSAFLEKGLLIRPLNNSVYLLPPFSITVEELNYAYNTINDVLAEL